MARYISYLVSKKQANGLLVEAMLSLHYEGGVQRERQSNHRLSMSGSMVARGCGHRV